MTKNNTQTREELLVEMKEVFKSLQNDQIQDIMMDSFKNIGDRYRKKYIDSNNNEYLLNISKAMQTLIDRVCNDPKLEEIISVILKYMANTIKSNIDLPAENHEIQLDIVSILWGSNIKSFLSHIPMVYTVEESYDYYTSCIREIGTIVYAINDVIETNMPFLQFKLDVTGIMIDFMAITYPALYKRFTSEWCNLCEDLVDTVEDEALRLYITRDVYTKFITTFITLSIFDQDLKYDKLYDMSYQSATQYKNFVLEKF